MLNLTILDNGDLEVSAIDPSEVQDMIDGGYQDDESIMCELFESESCNGSYTPFEGRDGDPFIGLFGGPCIAPEMDIDDYGNRSIPQPYFWYLNEYCFKITSKELAKGRSVIYTLFRLR